MDMLVNKVAESGIVTIDLAEYLPQELSMAEFDLKPFLFREMILREKDYRAALQTHDWQQYEGKHVALFCSADAIIPMWAFMLAASHLQPVSSSVFFGTRKELENALILSAISRLDLAEYAEKRVVLKGCGEKSVPEVAYVAITARLRPLVKSLMYGEPCSTVPVYKKR